jgi:hypothetical protein
VPGLFGFVGVAGFEPATLWSQTRCANRAALHPALTSEALSLTLQSFIDRAAKVAFQKCRKNKSTFYKIII